MKIIIDKSPFGPEDASGLNFQMGRWPVFWVAPIAVTLPAITIFRLDFKIETAITTVLHVAADERYELYVDDLMIGRGNASGDFDHWFYDSWQIELTAGMHNLCAKVVCWGICGENGPLARISLRPAFLLAANDALMRELSTGLAPWKCRSMVLKVKHIEAIPYCEFTNFSLNSPESQWDAVKILYPGRTAAIANEYQLQPILTPSTLPPMHEKIITPGVFFASYKNNAIIAEIDSDVQLVSQWQSYIAGNQIEIAPYQKMRIILTFDNYYCAYYKLQLSGGYGAKIQLAWAEATFDGQNKGQRDIYWSTKFAGYGDTFISDGQLHQHFDALFWNSGRLVELTITNASESLILNKLEFIETHYPLDRQSSFQCSDPQYNSLIKLFVRTLEMCTHDVFMDCPYYERLMYIGDARIEALAFMITTLNAEPVKRALTLFASSRNQNGLTLSRYPARIKQVIPTYSLLFINLLNDYALWRNDESLVKELLPRTREILSFFKKWVSPDGLLVNPDGWNFVDWAITWEHGEAPTAIDKLSCAVNWQYVYALGEAAGMEEHFGEPEIAKLYRRQAKRTTQAIIKTFWDVRKGLFADDSEHLHYSEHAQCIAILASQLNASYQKRILHGLINNQELTKTTVYFSHYLFEAAHQLKAPELIFPRLKYWLDLPEQGFKTVPERPEPSRSDCHAWGTHPFYHYFATILGIRPASYGFQTVEISPLLGELNTVSGKLAHPAGEIYVELHKNGNQLKAIVQLPAGVSGIFKYGDVCHQPITFMQEISLTL